MKNIAKLPKRKLKVWNGRGHGKYDRKHISVAAYSKKQAAEIIEIACSSPVSVNEINVYYSPCWGNSMIDIVPVEPCVYIEDHYGKTTPVRVY